MRTALITLALSTVTALPAQSEVLYYKFEGGGTKALNYAASSPAPGEGPVANSLVTPPTTSFVPGPHGLALTSGRTPSPYEANFVDTGWSPNVTGDYTWAMWLHNSRGTPGPSLTYVAGVPVSGAFRIYSGSSILLTVGGAGGTAYYRTVANVYQMATAGWVHVAFVVDTTAMTATYYINGVPEASLTLTGMPAITGPSFHIGRQNPTSAPSIYDIDEFRFLTRTAQPAEIATWATTHTAGASDFGRGCDASLTSSNGLPQVGNLLYGFTASAPVPGSAGFLMLGFSRTSFQAIPLPADLGAFFPQLSGCHWECSNDVSLLMVLGGSGTGSLAFPIPPLAQYDQTQIYAQGLFIGGPRGLMSTNPVGIVVGY